MNSRKPTLTAPSTPITRALSGDGRSRPKAATASPHIARINTQRTSEPSWFPQVPVILYSSGFREWLFCTTFSTVVSLIT